jgi:hypothetical protein
VTDGPRFCRASRTEPAQTAPAHARSRLDTVSRRAPFVLNKLDFGLVAISAGEVKNPPGRELHNFGGRFDRRHKRIFSAISVGCSGRSLSPQKCKALTRWFAM